MLENTIYRLKKDKRLTIGFFGGSITEGAGASDPSKTSWRGSVTDWFRAQYPDCGINPIQAAIGGTGSSLGIFRAGRDLLSKHPDLVFIEYSVNDGLGNYDEILSNSETIVRKIYADNPYADIIYVHTTTKGISEHIAKGGEYTARSAHSAVMHRYAIPQIDMGEILRSRVLSEGGDWLRYTTDTVHPNDEGYKIYTNAVTDFLSGQLSAAVPGFLTGVKLPEPLSDLSRLEARLEDSYGAFDRSEPKGWHKTDKSLCGRYEHYIEADEAGAELVYSFNGRRVGLYLMLAKDSGDLIWSIDGGEERTLRTWDHYCKSFNRAGGMLLGGELPNGPHTLKLRVSADKADESEGRAIRIGAFMVY